MLFALLVVHEALRNDVTEHGFLYDMHMVAAGHAGLFGCSLALLSLAFMEVTSRRY